MERFQGKFELCSLDRKTDMISLEVQAFAEAQSFIFEEEEEDLSLKDTIPFLQMLQNGDPSPFITLLSLHNPYDLESYKVQDFHSLIQSETNQFYQKPTMEGVNHVFSSQNMNPSSSANSKRRRKTSQEMSQEKRKRKRSKPIKNIEDMENQRIIHIAVERNRRRLMNDHINSLRALLPPSYIQRGDQASIVGGAINYVKFLEQLIQSLESRKRMQQSNGDENVDTNQATNLLSGISSNTLRATPKIEATVIQNHVNLKVQCQRKQGQLLKGIISLEELRLTVLHLNIASSGHESVSYSFNLKIEDDCDLQSADEITAAARQIFDVQRLDSTSEPKRNLEENEKEINNVSSFRYPIFEY